MDSGAILTELPRLRRYARALVGDRAAADDLVQDTLERAWTRIAQWRAGSDLRGLAIRAIDDVDFAVPTRATQSDGLEIIDLEAALAQLPEEQRTVLLLVALEEMRYEEVAATLAIPVGTVMSRLSRGRERLRLILEGRPPSANLRVVR